MLTFYYAPGTCALAFAPRPGIPGRRTRPSGSTSRQQQQRCARVPEDQPKGRVPALVTDRGVLTETPALLQYIAQSFPQAQLAPLDDAFLLAKVNEFNSYLCSTVHVNHAHKGAATAGSDRRRRRWKR
jgi:glutathione S-transferase